MTKYILALCALSALTSCSGSAKANYGIEADWYMDGWEKSENEDISCVERSTNGDGTYQVDESGSVA